MFKKVVIVALLFSLIQVISSHRAKHYAHMMAHGLEKVYHKNTDLFVSEREHKIPSQPANRIGDGPSKNLLKLMVFRSELNAVTRLPTIYDLAAYRFLMLKNPQMFMEEKQKAVTNKFKLSDSLWRYFGYVYRKAANKFQKHNR